MTISDGININPAFSEDDVFVFPASYGQKRMWFLDQFEPGSPYYNIPVAFKITGEFKNEYFVKTINLIVDRHESIRTTFTSIKGEPQQVIIPELKINIPLTELTGETKDQIKEQVKSLVRKEARKPFDLSKGPLFRVQVLKMSDNEHVVLITMHHIISDGWSMGILVGEITSIYSSLINNKSIEIQELEIQYADFSEWQNKYLSGEVLENQFNYWKNKLGDSNSLLELPTDRSRQAVFTNNGASLTLLIPKDTIDGLQKISNKENATMFMTLLAAFNVLLYRYTGQDDINIGTPIANRTDKDIEKIIGLFINTLVLRTQMYGNPTFIELLKQVRKTNLDAFDHQDLPFEMLVDAIQPERNMSYAPLFQVMLVLQNNPIETTKLSDIQVSMIDVDMGTATSDITYSIAIGINGASCSIEYNTDLFDESTISRMFNDFNVLLKEIVSNPNVPISNYAIVEESTKIKILNEWGTRKVEFPKVNSIHNLVERWAEKTPNAIAVVDSNRSITYQELNESANNLAHYLIDQKLDKNLPIGISQNKTVNLLVTVLGILKGGFAYLPLDPNYPKERLNYMVENSAIELLVSDSENKNLFDSFAGKNIVIDELEVEKNYPITNPNISISPNDLTYIIYTSGSTGKAKGTMIHHESLVNIYLGWEKDYKLLEDARSHLQMASFSFDVFGGDWTRALCSGGKLVLVTKEQLLDAEKLYEIILQEKIDIGEFVPAVLRNLIEYVEKNDLNLEMFKVLIAGSDVWYVKEYNDFKKFCSKNVRLINSFGLTETAIDSTFFETNDLSLPDEKLVPIGKPFPNIELYILDENLNIVPVGVKGELYIGGVSLARGFYKKPGLTAEKFIPNKYGRTEGARIYKTGDVARYLPDGNIEFLGRADHQIKLRGFRIELGEIENALTENKFVKDAVVILREDENEKRLVAYIVGENEKDIDTNEIRNFVAERVPDYMIPAAFVVLDKLPLTPNGKVDRKSLPKPDLSQIQEAFEVDYVEPRNKIEQSIVEIWKEVLKIEKVGVQHNFFLLGGHSLLATQVISRIKSDLKVDLPLRVIFEKPILEDIASEVEKLSRADVGSGSEKITPQNRTAYVPLSFSQERLWFLDQLEPNSPFYNIPEYYRVHGDIDLNILEQAFNQIIERHESLRTYFTSDDGSPLQVIVNQFDHEFDKIDLQHYSEEEKENQIKTIINLETRTPITINELPLFRTKILILSQNEYIIALNIHHIISDDWSSKIMMSELGVIYESIKKGVQAPLPEILIQYADYSIWQRNWLKDETFEKHINYWKNHFRGLVPLLELPTDYIRPKTQTFNGDFISFELDNKLVEKIHLISKEEGATTFMVLLAAFKILMYKLSGQPDVCIGTPNANRNRKEIEQIIGFFVNTLALRTDCSGDPTFTDFLLRIKETTLSAYSHQDLPFETIVDAVNPERNLSHSPIFQVMFVHQKADNELVDERNAGKETIQISPVESHSKTSKFDLTLFVVESDNEISGAFEFNTDLFTKNTIEEFVKYFSRIIDQITLNKHLPVDKVQLLTPGEQKQVMSSLNNVDSMSIISTTVPEKFSALAKKIGNETAVSAGEDKFSFSQLEEDSNKLANYLIKSGVGSEKIIGICLPRSYEMIVALLGILKSGAAYLPIDPKYPQDRINYIIDDANVEFVITNETLNKYFEGKVAKLIFANLFDELLSASASTNPKVQIDDLNICYVIYTSGSTGNPKGTLLTHKGFANYISWTHHAYPLNQDNGSLVHSTISFDATITSIFPSLLAGKKIILMNESEEIDELANIIKANNKLSLLKITPAHLELLSNLISKEDAKDVADAMIIGGENLTSKQIKYWQTNSPHTNLFNEYGPTEAVVGCVVYDGKDYKSDGSVPIGEVIPNVNVYVLGKYLEQVPNGVIGELHIGGISLARGYLNKPELTAEKFIPNPFSYDAGERLYKTGDLVKILSDGSMIFIGRMDDQVKVRGYRIELGEIESKLSQINNIKEVVVDIKEFGDDDKRIIAYTVNESKIDQQEVFELLKNDLPDYMIPAAIVEIEEIPLTINGKVDRKSLPIPNSELRAQKTEIVLPGTDTEKNVHAIWKEVLNVDEISIYDNFFDLGGHSLLVTKLAVRIEKYFDITFPIRSVFAYPTIAQIAREIEFGTFQENISNLPPLKTYDNKDKIPLSFTQRRLWFLDKLDPGQSIYNMPMAVKINGQLNVELIQKSIDYIANRHESLRTNFYEKEGTPFQTISDQHRINSIIEDINGLTESEQNQEILRVKNLEAITPFNLENDSLIRFRILKLSDEKFVIYFTMHHIISDGWSINIILREFVQTYTAFQNGKDPDFQPLEIQYSDYAIWQKENLEGELLDKQIDYWKKKLSNIPNNLELPTDKPRPLVKTFNGGHKSFIINESSVNLIEEFAKEHKITSYMFLLGVFQMLLSKLSGLSDICVGTPIANRKQVETEKIIGFFANTLVIRTKLDGANGISQLFDEVKNNVLEAFENQDAPFEKLVELLKPERDLSNTPLFQVMFVLQTNEQQNNNNSEAFIEPLEADSNSTQYDLTMSMNASGDEWLGTVEFNTDLFNENTIEDIIDSYQTICREIVTEKKERISEIKYLGEDETSAIINNSFGRSEELDQKNVLDRFSNIVSQYPNKIACEYKSHTISFNELEIKSNQICNYLHENGFSNEDIIAVSLPKSIALIEWLIGIMKAGCCYMPIDTSYPDERIQYMLYDSNVKLIINDNDKSFLDEIIHINCNKFDDELKRCSEQSRLVKIDQSNLAYVIYTSGSTGRPKGVMLHHRGLLNLVHNQIRDFKVSCESRVLQFASISFDASISEIFMGLLSGATLILPDKKEVSNTTDIYNILRTKQISVVTLPPSLIQVMENKELPDLVTLISAGEKLNVSNANNWNKDNYLINAYGPTEATVGVSSHEFLASKPDWSSVPIGKPINNVDLFILDKDLNIVRNGTVGEIYIGGISLARGYINKPDLSADKFIPNPYSNKPGDRLYKTGDLGKFNSDGIIEYIGRIDAQVKLRGFRIELSEIESVLNKCKEVSEAVAIVNGVGEKAILAAFVKLNKDYVLEVEKLRLNLKDQLPDYMIPGLILEIESIPLSVNGKIDRKKLPTIDELNDYSAELFVEPSNDIEIKLLSIWQNLLNLNKISIVGNFFELGGHSLLATQLLTRIENEFDVSIQLKDLFERVSIADQAVLISRSNKKSNYPRITKVDNKPDHIPLSFTQQRLWILDKIETEQAVYNIPTALKLIGEIDKSKIENTLKIIIEKHESLRTNFYSIDDIPYQKISSTEDVSFRMNYIDSSLEEEEYKLNQIRSILTKEANHIFDLENESLFRFTLIKIDNDEHIISFVFHHIITDGWSINLLLNDFSVIYASFNNNVEYALKKLDIQYSDFALWQRDYLEGEILDSQLNYWKNKLNDFPPILELPLDKDRPILKSFNGNKIKSEASLDFKQRLNKYSVNNSVSPFMVLLAVYKVLLSKLSTQKDIMVGTPIANRNQFETEQIVGFFANTLVMRTELFEDLSFSELLTKVKNTSLEAFDNQDVPFEKLVDTLQPERDTSHSPLFQVMFVLQNNPTSVSGESDIKIEPVENEFNFTQYDITLSAEENSNGYTFWFEYNTDLFEEKTIEMFLKAYENILELVITNPSTKLSEISLINDKAEIGNIIRTSTGAQINYSSNSVLKEFENVVENYSNKICAVDERSEISYNEVNRESNKLAQYLVGEGIKVEDPIAVMLPKSIDTLICILGIMKAGGVYLPIDSNYPDERINYMINDSSTKLVITEEETALVNDVKYINVSELFKLAKRDPEKDIYLCPNEDNLAYIIYTSGSTGLPKGTMLTHKGLLNLTKNQISVFNISEDNILLQFASLSFDASISEIFTSLLSGSQIVFESNENLKDISKLTSVITERKINIATFPPSLLNVLDKKNFPNLLTLVSAGESLSNDIANKWYKDTNLINAYGPTESTVGVSSYSVEALSETNSVPIGKAYNNIELYILDNGLNIVPQGVVGELYIGGSGLARGYVGNASKTAESFIPNPFRNGERIYKTGDAAKFLKDGNIEFISRIDNQIKLRGYRIELGEIESCLRNHTSIKEAVVDIRLKGSSELLVAFIITENSYFNKLELHDHLKKQLPEYMIPNVFVEIDKVIKNNSGKVDRTKLLFDTQSINDNKELILPRNETEEELSRIWQELLGTDKISVYDNFFELGGHSLLAIQLIGKIEKAFDVELEMVQLFKDPTISSLNIEINKNINKVENIDSLVVKFNHVEGSNPIFLIHPSGGSVHWYSMLANEFKNDRSVYGIQALGIGGKVEPQTTVEEMASTYIEAIKKIKPEGPYIIGSWSMGVVIAYEMARMLNRDNQAIQELLILDQGPILPNAAAEDSAEFLSRMFMGRLEFDLEELRKLSYDDQLKVVLKRAKKEKEFPKIISFKRFKIYVNILKVQQDAWRNYKLSNYSGEMTLIKSKDSNYDYYSTPEFDWERFVEGEIKMYVTEGDHNTMLHQPRVKSLASLIKQILNK